MLIPGGRFLYADFFAARKVDAVVSSLVATGFEIIDRQDITSNVVRALEQDHARKMTLMERYPKFLHGLLQQFAATEGSRSFRLFREGRVRYMSFALRRP